MKKHNTLSTIFFTYFGFGTFIGILLALLAMTISNSFITHHDAQKTQAQHTQIYRHK